MRYAEIVTTDSIEQIEEAQPQKPLTPAQATKRQARINKAQSKINDTKATNSIKLQAAQRKLSDIDA